ncbi:MAG: hypothetical protein WC623_22255 [Pedobacter sp.]|uniref:hypothetical protein n=1 Tax=Pedobacter sp. TaxID=1411316 RepID=UPI0035614C4A
MKQWEEFDLTTGKPTGQTMLFMDGITPEYYLNICNSGWIMSDSGKTCMNPKSDKTWHIRKS